MKKLLLLILPILFALPNFAHADITTGLVGWWKFDEGSGSTAIDSSGNGFNGTERTSPTYVVGKIGPYALSLNGTNQNVTTSYVQTGITQYTIAAWVKMTASSG